jgi:hypothetical protein
MSAVDEDVWERGMSEILHSFVCVSGQSSMGLAMRVEQMVRGRVTRGDSPASHHRNHKTSLAIRMTFHCTYQHSSEEKSSHSARKNGRKEGLDVASQGQLSWGCRGRQRTVIDRVWWCAVDSIFVGRRAIVLWLQVL